MTWDVLLEEFRAAGGIAENIRLGEGARGRGIFPVDPALPARLHMPLSLTVPLESVEVRAGELVARRDAVDPAAADFFDHVQRSLGWSAGGYEAALAEQRAWHELPEEVIRAIAGLGVLQRQRFLAPSEQTAFDTYATARVFSEHGKSFFIHFVDLVNHNPTAAGFVRDHGVGVAGMFADEVVVRYNDFDPIDCALTFGFGDRCVFANSISLTIDLPNGMQMSIERSITTRQKRGSVNLPMLQEKDGRLHASHIVLGNLSAPDLPRAIFRKLLEPYTSAADADAVFDGLAHFNRTRFLAFLRTLRRYSGPMISMLEDAAINQLEALSACIGARRLD